jgi:acetyltransferase-like isoleucine patch superfamily enzyme
MGEILVRIFAYIRGFFLKRKFKTSGPLISYGKTIVIKRNGVIEIGKHTRLWPDVKLVAMSQQSGRQAIIRIGDYSSLGDRTQVHCSQSVTIGNYALIAWDVNILEHDYHAPGGGNPIPEPITIEDEVWIACRCIILKGVTIGKGAIIGAGSVVTKSIPPYTFAAGNPARIIKKVASWKGSTDRDW